jgi:hypothetical protein
VLSVLGVPPDVLQSTAWDVNDDGIIVGDIITDADFQIHAAMWAADGTFLGRLPELPDAVNGSAALAIEGHYVAGQSNTSLGTARAIRWTLPHSEYGFRGFFRPVRNNGALNRVKAGASVPVKFALAGNQGLDVLAANSPTTESANCGSVLTTGPVEPAVSRSGPHYDAGQYLYVWKTRKAWAGTCRTFVLKLKDGTQHIALFQFK